MLIQRQVASSVPFDNSSNGFLSTETQSAIEETKFFAAAARYAISAGYNGNATSGRYLEWFTGVASNDAPFIVPKHSLLQEISLSTGTATTVSVGVYQNGTLIETISLTSEKTASMSGISDMLDTEDEISIKIISGSISKPVIFLFLQTE